MNAWKKGLLLLAGAGFLAGCIPSQQQLRMERDLEEMKRRLAETERSNVALRQDRAGDAQLETLGRRQADLQASLDALRVEIQSLNGRLEDRGRQHGELRSELTLVRDDLTLRLAALEERLQRLEGQPRAPAAAPAASSAQGLYEQGLESIQKRNEFARGRELLQQFLNQNPQSPLAANAMYWIGEAWYGEKKFENAILQFQDVIQKYGDHPKAASAMLKQGLAFQVLGDVRNARAILQRVIDTFPLSEEAKKAKDRLAEWQKR